MAKKKHKHESPVGNLIVPPEDRRGGMVVEPYTDAMNGFMRYMWTGHFRKKSERQNP